MTSPADIVSLGLTGSIGSGKSFVERIFEDFGHPVFDADHAVRELTAKGQPGLQAIVAEFGSWVRLPDGRLDRAALAACVFADENERKRLEDVLHPLVRDREIDFLSLHRKSLFPVLSVPLLFETGAERHVSHTAVVVIDEQTRFNRLALREDRLTRPQIAQRLAAQMPQEGKARRADFIIDNSSTREATRKQVKDICRKLDALSES